MTKKLRIQKGILIILSIAYLLGILSLKFSMDYYTRWRIEPIAATLFSLILVFTSNLIMLRKGKFKEALELNSILFIAATLMLLGMLRNGDNIAACGGKRYSIQILLMILIPYSCNVMFLATYFRKVKEGFRKAVRKIWEHRIFEVLLLIGIIIAVCHIGYNERGDELIMFRGIERNNFCDLLSLDALSSSHPSIAYNLINGLFKSILGSTIWGMSTASIILYALSCSCFYLILHDVIKNKKNYEYALLSAPYLFSPFILGMSWTNSWDYWTMVLFPIVIWTEMKKKYILHLAAVFLLLFSKEPMIIVYFAFCLGILFRDLKQKRNIFLDGRYYMMLILGVSWLIVFLALPTWGGVSLGGLENGTGDGSFGGFAIPTMNYFIEKSKVLFICQFNWLLAGIGLFALVVCKNRLPIQKLLPALLGDIAFLIFSYSFTTVNIIRYIDVHISILILIAVLGISCIDSNKIRNATNVIVIMIMLISCFYTLDPVTKLVYDTMNVGSKEVIGNRQVAIYNFEEQSFDRLLNHAIKENLGENVLHVMPQGIGHLSFEGAHYWHSEEIEDFYYDCDENRRYTTNEAGWGCITSDMIHFRVINIVNESKLEEYMDDYNHIYYYYLPNLGFDKVDGLNNHYTVGEPKIYSDRQWMLYRIEIFN